MEAMKGRRGDSCLPAWSCGRRGQLHRVGTYFLPRWRAVNRNFSRSPPNPAHNAAMQKRVYIALALLLSSLLA